MSDSQTTDSAVEPQFTVAEVEQLAHDDEVAGRAIGKMLSALFLYTVFAMIIVVSWTYLSVRSDQGAEPESQAASANDH